MAVNKHKAILDWLSTCPLLTDRPLFDFLSERHGSVGLAPVASDKYVRQYIAGNGLKQYQFEVQAMFAVSANADDTNIDNMQLMSTWIDWIEAQQISGHYPDFGEPCSGYRVSVTDNMPSHAMRYENGFAKYRFPASIQYYDATTTLGG